MFALIGDVVLENLSIVWQLAIPVVLFFFLLYNIVHFTTRRLGSNYQDSSTMPFHCTGRNCELVVAITLTAFATMPILAVSTLVGLLIEIPVMLTLEFIVLRRRKKYLRTKY